MKKIVPTCIVTCVIIITTSHCMITTPSFKPYIQVYNPVIQKDRENEKYLEHTINIEKILENNDSFRCLQYALKEITGFNKHFIFFAETSLDIPLNKFFKQISTPQAGCLAVYTEDHFSKTKHFAVDKINFKSKFGAEENIVLHKLFDIPSIYGNNAYFYSLKSKYKNDNKQLLLDLEKSAMETDLKHIKYLL